ncbi:MAG: sulfurtransferase [Gammaproteobacteria bacterium]
MKATLISPEELSAQLLDDGLIICDCRFSLTDPDAGRAAFEGRSIPGARYVDLEADMSGPITPETGRHPLPDVSTWIDTVQRLGLAGSRHIVAYDHGPGVFAARLWWMLGWVGVNHVSILDGGFAGWEKLGLSVSAGEHMTRSEISDITDLSDLKEVVGLRVSANDLERALGTEQYMILDAREPKRFSGQEEPLDKKAGHIPGATNRFLGLNLSDGCFKSKDLLRAEFDSLLHERNVSDVVHSCGSGVTACHNLFAMEYAGLSGSRLYPGSWSEWIADPSRPIETSS